jgi:hypothetical protein
MKLKAIIIILVFVPFIVLGQLKTTGIKYIGKSLRVNPLANSLKENGYNGFIYDVNHSIVDAKYPYPNGHYASEHDSLVNKVFSCIGAGICPDNDNFQYLKLKIPKHKIIYYVYSIYEDEPKVFTCVEFEQAKQDEINAQLEVVRKKYLKRTFWLKTPELGSYNDKTDVYGDVKYKHLQFEPVTIINIIIYTEPILNWQYYRATVKTNKGILGYFDFNGDDYSIANDVYLTNPVTTYKLTAAQVATVRKGDIYLGMSKKIVTLIKGEPDHVNTTTSSYGTHEQWVYGNNEYYYFENGKLTTVQN